MISNEIIVANAVSGKTARPCDCCIKKRARWYCPSDDAFLCQGCDGSVHSANPLAQRHERVLLKTSANSLLKINELPSWHRGSTRKMRTPRRHAKHYLSPTVVPELGCEDTTTSSSHYNDCELDDRVPIFDRFVPELYRTSDLDNLEEFAADVETLLGKGLDDELCGIDELGFLECNNDNDVGEIIKAESNDVAVGEPFDLSFIYDDDGELIYDYHEEEVCKLEEEKKMTSLRLDYDAISKAWASQGSPWISGERPHVNLHDYSWPNCLMGTIGGGETRKQNIYGQYQSVTGDGEREARVLRYREKRRKRLFSKKIRYEVRKLNAEKRPRMKGRFVKRSSNSIPPTSNTSF